MKDNHQNAAAFIQKHTKTLAYSFQKIKVNREETYNCKYTMRVNINKREKKSQLFKVNTDIHDQV